MGLAFNVRRVSCSGRDAKFALVRRMNFPILNWLILNDEQE